MSFTNYKPSDASGIRWLFHVQRGFSWLAIVVLQGSTRSALLHNLPTGNVAVPKNKLSCHQMRLS